MKQITKLEEICKPIVEYLNESFDSHTTIIITSNYIKVCQDVYGVPIEDKAGEIDD